MFETDAPAPGEQRYREIERALAGSALGRGFLAEFARRSRAVETRLLLDAIAGLERRVVHGAPRPDRPHLEAEIAALADHLRQVRGEIAGDAGTPDGAAGAETPGGLVRAAERAAAAVLDAAERIQETAWEMRESGFDPARCDELDDRATEIYGASSRQESCLRGLARLAELVDGIESRLGRLAGSRDPDPRGRPPLDPQPKLSAKDIDFVLRDGPEAAPAPSDRDLALAELARIDGLDMHEKLRLFT